MLNFKPPKLHISHRSIAAKRKLEIRIPLYAVSNNVPGTTILLSLNEQVINVTMLNNIVGKLEFFILVFGDILR